MLRTDFIPASEYPSSSQYTNKVRPLVTVVMTLFVMVLLTATTSSHIDAQDAARESAQEQASIHTPLGVAFGNIYGQLPSMPTEGDVQLLRQTKIDAARLNGRPLADIKNRDDWESVKATRREELREMLGLEPMPAKTPLQATITGREQKDGVVVEKLVFQSRPGLYVTANVYSPIGNHKRLPTVLYVSGHGPVIIDGVSYGNKVSYQHHGAWFAQNGYVCLILDTVQMGEIQGIHHGTYRENLWWWNSRGYTSAGAEAWNCIRALDYLETRLDVDVQRIGVTGRSGGGAYSWWLAALDDRIAAACPVAGITDLQNHVIDGCVEGHCDCMYLVNTYRWDYAQVAALVAPRPLLICNTDKDTIFPLDGIVRLHSDVRRLYNLLDSSDAIGLLITEGPHKDSQDLQVPVMRWFNRWLKNDQAPVGGFATPLFTPQQLKVLERIPEDEITSRCYENFTTLAVEGDVDSDTLVRDLQRKTFAAIQDKLFQSAELRIVSTKEPAHVQRLSCRTDDAVEIDVFVFRSAASTAERVQMVVADHELAVMCSRAYERQKSLSQTLLEQGSGTLDPQLSRFISERGDADFCVVAPRGVGRLALSDGSFQTHLRRRMMLVGSTLATGQVLDTVNAIHALNNEYKYQSIRLSAVESMQEVAGLAAIFCKQRELNIVVDSAMTFRDDKEGPDFINWRRIATPQQLTNILPR